MAQTTPKHLHQSKSIRYVLLLLLLFISSSWLQAQFSRVHYMPVSIDETGWNIDDPTYFLTTLPGVNATVRVINTSDGSVATTLNVLDGQTTEYRSPYSTTAMGANNMGLRFESDQEFSIVGNGDPDNTLMSFGWSSKGEAGIGREFGVFTPASTYRANGNHGFYLSILAVEDADVTLSGFFQGNGTISLTEGQGQVVFMGNSNDYRATISGIISSTGDIVVLNQTNQMFNGGIDDPSGGSDDGADMLVPHNFLGTQYIVGRTALEAVSSEYVAVVGALDNTSVTVNGTVRGSVNRGELLLLTGADWSSNVVMQIDTNQPAYVWHKTNTYNPSAPTFSQQDGYLLVPPVRICGNRQNEAVIAENAFQSGTAGRVVVITAVAGSSVSINGAVQTVTQNLGDFDFYRIEEANGNTSTIESTEAISVTVVSFDSDASTGVSYAGWELTVFAEIEVSSDSSGSCEALSTVDIATTGGSGNFLYYLSEDQIADENDPDNYQASSTFTGLRPGTYIVWIFDVDTGCPVESEAIVPPTTGPTTTDTVVQPTCPLDDGSITLTTTGGSGNFIYYVSTTEIPDENDQSNYSTQNSYPNLTPGTYHIWMMDTDATCPIQLSDIVLIDTSPQTVNQSITPITCDGDLGMLTLQGSDVANQRFYVGTDTLTDPSDINNYVNQTVFDDLAAGEYEVWVIDANTGCYRQLPNVQYFETALTAEVRSFDPGCLNNDGIIDLTASGGSGNLVYYVSQNPISDENDSSLYFSENRVVGLTPGTYELRILDVDNGCTLQLPSVSLIGVDALQARLIVSDIGCSGNDGAMRVVSGDSQNLGATGGTGGGYRYQLLQNGQAVGSPVDVPIFEDLVPGTYSVEVTDGSQCSLTTNEEFIIAMDLSATVQVDYSCSGSGIGNTVSLGANDADAGTTFMYALDSMDPGDFQLSSTFTNVAVGDHFIAVLNENGCISTDAVFTIDLIETVSLSVNVGNRINVIDAEAMGGEAPYEYFLNGESNGSSGELRISETGTHEITVMDALGCIASATIFLQHMDVTIPNFFTPDNDGINDGWRPNNQDDYPNIETIVYDRYGRVVAILPFGVYWDGTYQAEPVPTGDYWYVVELNDPNDDRNFVGHFSLYR